MNNLIKEVEIGNYVIVIHYDEYMLNPRTEFDNIGTILYTSTRYSLGDKQVSIEEIKETQEREDVFSLPVYAYIHSGFALNTTGFSCPWDSGQCGIIYVEKDKAKSELHFRTEDELEETVYRVFNNEIDTFQKYLNGEGYRFQIFKKCEHCGEKSSSEINSCSGFYEIEDCENEATSIVNFLMKEKENV